MTDDKKVKADDYGDIVVKSLNSLRQKNELCDFRVSAGGHVFDVSYSISRVLTNNLICTAACPFTYCST